VYKDTNEPDIYRVRKKRSHSILGVHETMSKFDKVMPRIL